MKKITIKLLLCLVIASAVLSCAGCSLNDMAYYPGIPRAELKKIECVTFSVGGNRYNYSSSDDDFSAVCDRVEDMLNSAKLDASSLFSGKVKMPCTDEAVSDNKAAANIWFEIFIADGEYKKIFFTMDSKDTQSIWIYATSTDSYSDGRFLKHYSCDCKELLTLLDSYNAE